MTILRSSMPAPSSTGHQASAASRQITVRPITLALVALLIAGLVALTIALAGGGGGSDQTTVTKSVHVAPSSPPAQRAQPPGVHGPGARP